MCGICCPTSAKCVAKFLVKVTFGASLALVGLAHLMSVQEFSGMVASNLGPLSPLGMLWGYLLPLLMIVGGVLTVCSYRHDIAAWAAGVALGSIAVGMLLKTVIGGMSLGEAMPAAQNALLWLLFYFFAVKCMCCPCDKGQGMGGGGGHSCGSC